MATIDNRTKEEIIEAIKEDNRIEAVAEGSNNN